MPLQVNAGDKVILPPFGGSPVKVQGEVSYRNNTTCSITDSVVCVFFAGVSLVPRL
jgi:hypothetical protein